MDEQMRRAYLKAMDIDVYYCRRALAGAAPTPDYPPVPAPELPESPTRAVKQARQQLTAAPPDSGGATRRRAASALGEPSLKALSINRDATRGLSAEANARSTTETAASEHSQRHQESANPGNESSESALQFALRCYAPFASIAVIDEIPYARGSGRDDSSPELLLAILRALLPAQGQAGHEQLLSAVNQPAIELRYETIKWPLGPGLDGSARAAREMVLGFVRQRFAAPEIQHLLLLSPQLCELLPLQFATDSDQPDSGPAEASAGQGRMGECRLLMQGNTAATGASATRAGESGADEAAVSSLAGRPAELEVTATHSLTALLAYPSLKRETWMHLQRLRRRLAG